MGNIVKMRNLSSEWTGSYGYANDTPLWNELI